MRQVGEKNLAPFANIQNGDDLMTKATNKDGKKPVFTKKRGILSVSLIYRYSVVQ